MLWKVVYTFLVVLLSIVASALSASVGARRLKREISYITFCPIIDGETSVEECQQINIQPRQCLPFELYPSSTWRNVKRVAVDAVCVRLYSARGCVGFYREITEEQANGNIFKDFSSFSLCNWHNMQKMMTSRMMLVATAHFYPNRWPFFWGLHTNSTWIVYFIDDLTSTDTHTLVFLIHTRVHELGCDYECGQTMLKISRFKYEF